MTSTAAVMSTTNLLRLPAASKTFGMRRCAPCRRSSLAVRSAFEQSEGPSEKSLEIMRKFSEQYARTSDTYFCMDLSVTAVVIKGLAEHKDTLGAPLCPCRHYDDKAAEAAQGFWNCPCVPMRERKECHCMLFLTEDNDFAGEERAITMDQVKDMTAGF
mmetsp:Transcript_31852/g.61343  ORF Transcript_31852/g.61343 Transcript_31852/m.61343 type:complete len:159 (+) Transcript_31852:79-555(+)|eukprot:CAMPEP_0114243656 /NCGR_PEP_ID=MMETSP0058-20121206/10911_1 /TAXON_ID=36894 /ORGANISM="Pyramimonas parkeae, CCMP726" /LENGTH=158 /DNA_ID=CAMNT_0001356521 /DNA_START=59 /DNA_END=535 /DNA_ORIENTATION=-